MTLGILVGSENANKQTDPQYSCFISIDGMPLYHKLIQNIHYFTYHVYSSYSFYTATYHMLKLNLNAIDDFISLNIEFLYIVEQSTLISKMLNNHYVTLSDQVNCEHASSVKIQMPSSLKESENPRAEMPN